MSECIHGDNIRNKLKGEKDRTNQSYLRAIQKRYEEWIESVNALKGKRGRKHIKQLVADLNAYKDFIDQAKFRKEKGKPHGFTSQSKLHSTVIEEFMYHLLVEIPQLKGKHLEYGPTHAYSNLYFSPASLVSFESKSGLSVNTKDQDFAISKRIQLTTSLPACEEVEHHAIHVPVVSIECKTYLDKTMYEGSVATAEKIKRGNPYSLFLIVAETYEVSAKVDPSYSEIDQIYILRRKSSRDLSNRNPIYADIVEDLYKRVATHLNSPWRDVDEKIKSGKLI